MIFTDEFLATFSEDPITATISACTMALNFLTPISNWSTSEMEAMEEADVLMNELHNVGLLPAQYLLGPLQPGSSRAARANAVRNALEELRKSCTHLEIEARKETLAKRIRIGLRSQFSYEFAPADYTRIQLLLNELRDHVAANSSLDPDHKRRILARLEALQRELHKRVSDLDRFWGLVGDAGVVMAKLGNDAKPIVDRIREIADIVWSTQGRAEQLPSSAKPPQIGYESADSRESAEH